MLFGLAWETETTKLCFRTISLTIAMTRAAEATGFFRSQELKLAIFMHGSGA